MNPIQEFMTKARAMGEAGRVKELEMQLLKAENENAELKAALSEMKLMKEKYQMALIEVIEVLQKYGCVG